MMTAAELARRLDGLLDGSGERVVCRVDTLEDAGADALSWVGSPEFLPRAGRSKAGVLLVSEECSLPSGCTLIHVKDPDLAVCRVAEWLAPTVDRVLSGVHPLAWVSPDASVEGAAVGAHVFVGAGSAIGTGTQLHPGAYVGSRVTIGRDCVLWPNVVVRERVTIGDRVVIHPNSTIGADGFGYLPRDGCHRKIPQTGTVEIEDDVEIGANSAVDRARTGVTRIGRGTKIDNLVQIAHNCDVGEHCIIVGQCGVGGSASLEHHVILGGQTAVVDHMRIGAGARVAAKSMVCHNIPDGQTIRGVPAVENARFLREQASLRKLPKWRQELRALAERVKELER